MTQFNEATSHQDENGTYYVNVYLKDNTNLLYRNTVAESLTEQEANELTNLINRLGDRFLP